MKKKRLKPTVVGMGIIIDGTLYKPIEYDGDPWDRCEVCDCQKPCFWAGADIAFCEGFGEYALQRVGKVFDVALQEGKTLHKVPKSLIIDDVLYEAVKHKSGPDEKWDPCGHCAWNGDCDAKDRLDKAYCSSFGIDDILKRIGKITGMTIGIATEEEKKPHETKEKELQ